MLLKSKFVKSLVICQRNRENQCKFMHFAPKSQQKTKKPIHPAIQWLKT